MHAVSVSAFGVPRLRAILQQSLENGGHPVQVSFETPSGSTWKFAIRMDPGCRDNELNDAINGRRVLVCGCPLGGQYLYTPAVGMERFIIIYCVGHVPSKRYGFCNEEYEPDTPRTWECPTDQGALDCFFVILSNLRQCGQLEKRIAFVGQSAGCQVLLAIAAAPNQERSHWRCALMVLIAPAYHVDMRALEDINNWITATSFFIVVAHQYDILCKIRAARQLEAVLQPRFAYIHVISVKNMHMWGRQHHDIGSSILSQLRFWNMFRESWHDWTSDWFLHYCDKWHIGECHIYDTPDVVMPNTWSSSFANQNAFCCLVLLICRDLLHNSLDFHDPVARGVSGIPAFIQCQFPRTISKTCSQRTWPCLKAWFAMMKHGSKDCSFLIDLEEAWFQYSAHASMLSQYCHSALHGAVHAKPRKNGFRNEISHGTVYGEPPVVFTKCCVMGHCALLEMRKTANYTGYWEVDWQAESRSTLMMGFMDIILLEIEASWRGRAESPSRVEFIYGAFIQDEHGKGKTEQHRDAVRAITFICRSDDALFCCHDNVDYKIKSITALRTSGQFKATQRWHTGLMQQHEYFQLLCASKPADVKLCSPLTTALLQWIEHNWHSLPPQAQHCHAVMFSSVHYALQGVSVVIGPPGTGKTSLIVAFVQLMQQWRMSTADTPSCVNILVVATTFEAGANVAERLCGVQLHGCDVVMLVAAGREIGCKQRFANRRVSIFTVRAFNEQLESLQPVRVRVVITTYGQTFANDTPFDSILKCLSNKFHYVFSDEAGQVASLDAVPTLACFHPNQSHWCIVGDPRQLPPFAGNGHETRNLLNAMQQNVAAQILLTQRRMVPGLADIVSHMFYEGVLKTEVGLHPSIVPFAMIILDNNESACPCYHCSLDNNGRGNIHEALIVKQLFEAYGTENPPFVLAYYAVQKKYVIENHEIDRRFVSTIDAVQGKQYPHVIITTGRTNGVGFSGDRRRITVGLSRGEMSGIIVTTSDLCRTSKLWLHIRMVADKLGLVQRVSMLPSTEHGVLHLNDALLGARLLQFLEARNCDQAVVQRVMQETYKGVSLQDCFNNLDVACVGQLSTRDAVPFSASKPPEQVEVLTRDDLNSEISDSDQGCDMTADQIAACAEIELHERSMLVEATLADLTDSYVVVRFTKLHKLQPYIPAELRNTVMDQAVFFEQLCYCLGRFLCRAIAKAHGDKHPFSGFDDPNTALGLLGSPACRLDWLFPDSQNLVTVGQEFTFGNMMEEEPASIQKATAFVKAMFMGGAPDMPIHQHKEVFYAGTHAMYIPNWKLPPTLPALFPTWSRSLVIHATFSRAVATALTCLGDAKYADVSDATREKIIFWAIDIPSQDDAGDAVPTATKKPRQNMKEDPHQVRIEILDANKAFQRGSGDVVSKCYDLRQVYIKASSQDLPHIFQQLGARTVGRLEQQNNT